MRIFSAMQGRQKALAFVVSALRPLATYAALSLLARSLSPLSIPSLVLAAGVPALLWWYSKKRQSLCGVAPAYASLLGHFGTALLTFIIKILPLLNAGLSITFLASSCAFGLVLTRVIVSDPGRVDHSCLERQLVEDYESYSNKSLDLQETRHSNPKAYDSFWRGKYCHYCHSFIERYDHHCAAVQNCIGLKNNGVFILLLITSCITEVLFLGSCTPYLKGVIGLVVASYHMRDDDVWSFMNLLYITWEVFVKETWLLSITVFVGLQVLWQVPFLIFQVFLIAINLTTDEWVNWEEIPRFYKETPGLSYQSKTFVNPYDEGCVRNFKAMFNKWK